MEVPKSFEQIRQGVEESQRATVWPETPLNSRKVLAFLWVGDPNAKPLLRAGLIVFAIFFLLGAVYIFSTFAEAYPSDQSALRFITGLGFALISLRLIRNALLRPPKRRGVDGPTV